MRYSYFKTFRISKPFRSVLFFTVLFLFSTTAYSQQEIIYTDDFTIAPAPDMGEVCKLPPTNINRNYFRKAEESAAKANAEARTAQFEIDYVNSCQDGSAWPQEAQTAFEYAMGLWETHLQSTVPIRIEAMWTQRDENVLGSAGPTRIVQLNGSGTEPETWYSIAQASAMTGQDIKDQIDGEDHDVVINMNCEFPDWYFGTDGNTPTGLIDFVTVVLHEIGHGIGFIGSMRGDKETQTADYGYGDNNDPVIYDRFTEDGENNALLNTNVYPNPSADLYEGLTGQRSGVFFDGEDSGSVFAGQPIPLYAPLEWNEGSSYSHIDQDTFSQQENIDNALMRPRIDRNFAMHSPGPVFCGMLSDWGWPLGGSCLELVGAEAEIIVDNLLLEDGLDFGVTNVGQRVDRSVVIENGAAAQDPLSYSITVETNNYVISPAGLASGSIDPGQSVEVTIRYIPQNDRIHNEEARISHNAMNAASPMVIALKGEALKEDEIARLEDNYPNPFNPSTTIPYVLPETSDVRLDIYNVKGQLIQTLVNSQQPEGRYEHSFEASGLASGIYFYRLIVDDFINTKQLLLIK